jgi:DNA polymerase alpha subunit A
MAELLADFGTKSTPKPIEKKMFGSKPKSKTFNPSNFNLSRLAQRDTDDSSIFVKKEVQFKTVDASSSSMPPPPRPTSSTNLKIEEVDMNMYDDDFGEDFMDDDMMDEHLLKKEVGNLSISDIPKPNFIATNKSAPRPDLQNWEAADAGMVDTFNQDTVKQETQKMDIFEKNGHLHMWWYDAYERKEKGYVYLFGKVLNKGTNKYVSCCVTVKNIERNLFVLPRKHQLDGKNLLILEMYIRN